MAMTPDDRRTLERLCDRAFGLMLGLDARGLAAIPPAARRRFLVIWRPFDAGTVRFDRGRAAFVMAFSDAVERVSRGGQWGVPLRAVRSQVGSFGALADCG